MKKSLLLIFFLIPLLLFGQSGPTKYGLITLDGKVIVEPRFSSIEVLSDKYLSVKEHGKWGVTDSLLNLLTPIQYESVQIIGDSLFLLKENGKYAVADTAFNLLSSYYDDLGLLDRKYPIELFISAIREPQKWETIKNNFSKFNEKYLRADSTYTFYQLSPHLLRFKHYHSDSYEGEHGIVDVLGNEKIPPRYDGIGKENNYLFKVMKNDKFGFLSLSSFEEVLPCVYDKVSGYKAYSYLYKNKNYEEFLMNAHGKIIFTKDKERAGLDAAIISDNRLIITISDWTLDGSRNARYGIIDTLGNIIQPVEENYIGSWYGDKANGVLCKDGKCAFINRKGEVITSFIYDKGSYGENNGARAKRDGMYYYLDNTGKEIFSKSNSIGIKSDSLNGVYVSIENEWRMFDYCDLKGNPIKIKRSVPDSLYRYQIVDPKTEKYGFADGNNKIVVPCIYDEPLNYKDGLSVFQKGKKIGIVDLWGKEIFPAKYANLEIIPRGGILIVNSTGKIGFADRSGKVKIPYKYSNTETTYSDYVGKGYIVVYESNKAGTISLNGDEIVPCEYESISPSMDKLIVKKNGETGLIDAKTGEIYLPCEYLSVSQISSFQNDIYKTSKSINEEKSNNGVYMYGIFDTSKKRIIIPTEYQSIKLLPNGSFLVYKPYGYGIIDSEGQILVPCQYSSPKVYNDKYIIVGQREQ